MDLTKVTQHPSPNHVKGRSGTSVKYIVLHATMGAFEGAISWLSNPKSQVSSHYCVSQKGEIVQLVDTADTAWHVYKLNQCSIGIEMESTNISNMNWYTPAMHTSVMDLVTALCVKYNLDETQVVRHQEPWIQDLGRSKGFAHIDPQWSDQQLALFRAEVRGKLDGIRGLRENIECSAEQ